MQTGNYIIVTDDVDLLKKVKIFDLTNFPNPTDNDTIIFLSQRNYKPNELKNFQYIFIPLSDQDKKFIVNNLTLNLFIVKSLSNFFYEKNENLTLKLPKRKFKASRESSPAIPTFMGFTSKNLGKFLGLFPYSMDDNLYLIYFVFQKEDKIKIFREFLTRDNKNELIQKYKDLQEGKFYNLDFLFKGKPISWSKDLKVFRFISDSTKIDYIYNIQDVKEERDIFQILLTEDKIRLFWEKLNSKSNLFEIFNIKDFTPYRLGLRGNNLFLVDFTLQDSLNTLTNTKSFFVKILKSQRINKGSELILALQKSQAIIPKNIIDALISIFKDDLLEDLFILISIFSKNFGNYIDNIIKETPEKFIFLIKEFIFLIEKLKFKEFNREQNVFSLNDTLFDDKKEFLDLFGVEDSNILNSELYHDLKNIVKTLNQYFWKLSLNYKGRSKRKVDILKRFCCLLPYYYQFLIKSYLTQKHVEDLKDLFLDGSIIKNDIDKGTKNKFIFCLELHSDKIESLSLDILESFIFNFLDERIPEIFQWSKNLLSIEILIRIFKEDFSKITGISLDCPEIVKGKEITRIRKYCHDFLERIKLFHVFSADDNPSFKPFK